MPDMSLKSWVPKRGEKKSYLVLFQEMNHRGTALSHLVMYIQLLCHYCEPYEAYLCFRDIKAHYDQYLASLEGLMCGTSVCTNLWRTPQRNWVWEEESDNEKKKSATKKRKDDEDASNMVP